MNTVRLKICVDCGQRAEVIVVRDPFTGDTSHIVVRCVACRKARMVAQTPPPIRKGPRDGDSDPSDPRDTRKRRPRARAG
jgi:hypothetical protein